jgi:hypothetical protein
VNFQVGTAQSAVASPLYFEGFGAGLCEPQASEAVTAILKYYLAAQSRRKPSSRILLTMRGACAARRAALYHIGI